MAFKVQKDELNRDQIIYQWVDDPNVRDVPNNHIYVDINGNVIQLYAEDETNFHSWGAYQADGTVNSDQISQSPPTFDTYQSMLRLLIDNGYQPFWDALHVEKGYSVYNYAQEKSPTWHFSIFIDDRYVNKEFDLPNPDAPISFVEAHRDPNSPIGRPLTHFVNDYARPWLKTRIGK